MLDVLQRPFWTGHPIKQAVAVRLCRTVVGRPREAVAELWTHEIGWELRLLVDGDFQRSQVCRSEDEVFTAIGEWRDALTAKGWRPATPPASSESP